MADYLLLEQASIHNVVGFIRIREKYCWASSHKENFLKFVIYFSPRIKAQLKYAIN